MSGNPQDSAALAAFNARLAEFSQRGELLTDEYLRFLSSSPFGAKTLKDELARRGMSRAAFDQSITISIESRDVTDNQTTEKIQELTAVVNQAANDINAQSKLALERLKAVPGGLECFRRELAKLNLDSATFDRLLSGDLQPEDHAALVLAFAGLKTATN